MISQPCCYLRHVPGDRSVSPDCPLHLQQNVAFACWCRTPPLAGVDKPLQLMDCGCTYPQLARSGETIVSPPDVADEIHAEAGWKAWTRGIKL